MKAKQRFYWLGILHYNAGNGWPDWRKFENVPEWAFKSFLEGYRVAKYCNNNRGKS